MSVYCPSCHTTMIQCTIKKQWNGYVTGTLHVLIEFRCDNDDCPSKAEPPTVNDLINVIEKGNEEEFILKPEICYGIYPEEEGLSVQCVTYCKYSKGCKEQTNKGTDEK